MPFNLIPISDTRHEISLDRLEAYLHNAVPEIAPPLQVEQFTYGQVTPIDAQQTLVKSNVLPHG